MFWLAGGLGAFALAALVGMAALRRLARTRPAVPRVASR